MHTLNYNSICPHSIPQNIIIYTLVTCAYKISRGYYTVPEAHVNVHNVIVLLPNSSQFKARRRIAAVTSVVGENTLEMRRDGDITACVREQIVLYL